MVKRVPVGIEDSPEARGDDPVRSVATFVVLTAESGDPLSLLAKRMKLFDCGALLVEDGAPTPAIVSERDVIAAVATGDLHATAAELATPQPLWIDADAEIRDAAVLMAGAGVRHLVVKDGDQHGIVSIRDVVKPLLSSMDSSTD
ncbi:MAG: CBS domain-containing protein [Acidimicrobiia bacterium]|nr:CBS domain-containing protein [Acidimicrobiia bacterium]MDH5519214.1 CBS domain-containing protein [Acidimicrobiia bacterium]